jgi:prepilin-type N-terminal cleavage/methylation domain-containing protein
MRTRGFTLVETMMSVAIFVIMIAGISTTVVAGRSAWEVNQNSVNVQTQVRAALWNISKDLRQAGTSLSLTQSATAVTIAFTHPVDGSVTYAWTQDAVSGIGDVTRQTTTKTRIIARNISELSLVNNGTDVVITATATGTSATRKADTMTLKEKVVMR